MLSTASAPHRDVNRHRQREVAGVRMLILELLDSLCKAQGFFIDHKSIKASKKETTWCLQAYLSSVFLLMWTLDYCTSLIHLSSQYACETQKSYYLHFTDRKLKRRGRKQAGWSPADTTAEISSTSPAAQRAATWSCLGRLLQLVPAPRRKAQASARRGFMYHASTVLVDFFANLACFVDGGKALKTKGWMKNPMTGPVALTLFFNCL